MHKVLLFDLDGTLLPMDTDEFVQDYLKVLAKRVHQHVDPDTFVKALLKGTEAMMTDVDPQKTNEQVFKETFLPLLDVEEEALWPVLDEFYEKVFPTLSHLSNSTPLSRHIVEEAIDQGYRVGVATNPLFPRSAIEHRLTWAGIDHIPFEIVTVYEECTFTKPHTQYYEMISDKLGVSPEACIMIGNDKQEDMSASQIGMKTYLVEDYVIDRGEPVYRIDQ